MPCCEQTSLLCDYIRFPQTAKAGDAGKLQARSHPGLDARVPFKEERRLWKEPSAWSENSETSRGPKPSQVRDILSR